MHFTTPGPHTMDISVGEILTIIVALTTAITTIIAALKVNAVHKLVNSAATEQRQEIATLRNIIATKQMESEIAEKTRIALAVEAGIQLAKTGAIDTTSSIVKP